MDSCSPSSSCAEGIEPVLCCRVSSSVTSTYFDYWLYVDTLGCYGCHRILSACLLQMLSKGSDGDRRNANSNFFFEHHEGTATLISENVALSEVIIMKDRTKRLFFVEK